MHKRYTRHKDRAKLGLRGGGARGNRRDCRRRRVCNGAVYAGDIEPASRLTRCFGQPGLCFSLFGSGGMRVRGLVDMSPGALVQRAAAFPRWGLDVTGRSPLLPQQTERPQTRARRAPGDACSWPRPASLSGRGPRAGRRRRDRVTMNPQPQRTRKKPTNTKLHKNHPGSASPNTTATTA